MVRRQVFQTFLQFLAGVTAGLVAIGSFPESEQLYLVIVGGVANALAVYGASKVPTP